MSDELQTYIEPELEARLVAWVLGEASAFEAEELERLVSERPELKACKERLEKIHGVLVAAYEEGKGNEWKLSKERREKILAKGEMARQEKVWRDELKRSRQRARRNRRRKLVMLCAACVVMGLLLMVSTPLVLRSQKSAYSMRGEEEAADVTLAALDEEIMAQSDLVRENRSHSYFRASEPPSQTVSNGSRLGNQSENFQLSQNEGTARGRKLNLRGDEALFGLGEASDNNPFDGDAGRKEQIAAALADLDAAMVEHRESAGEQDRSWGGVVDGKASPPRAIVIEDSAEMNEPAPAASVPVSPSSRPVRSRAIASNGVLPAPTTGPVAGKPGQAGEIEKKVAEQLQREIERVEAKSAKLESPGEPADKEQMTRKKEAGPVDPRAPRAITVDEMAQDDDFGAEGYFGKDAVPEEVAKGGEVLPIPTAKPAPAMVQPRSETIAGRALSEKAESETGLKFFWHTNSEEAVAEAEELGVNKELDSRLEKELSFNLSREDGRPSAQQQGGEQGLGETRERFAQSLDKKQNAPKGRIAGGFLAEEADRFGSDSEVKPSKGRSADFEVGRESEFVADGGMGGGGAEQTNRDFIDSVDRVEIPGIPPAPQDKVRGIVTAGNRSGAGEVLDGLEGATVEEEMSDRESGAVVSGGTSLERLDDPIRANQALTGEQAEKGDQVRRGLYKGEGYYDLGRYDEAMEEYKQVLRTDPYNKAARRGMERVAAQKSSYYRAAYDQTRAKMLAEVDKAWEESALPPADKDGDGVDHFDGFENADAAVTSAKLKQTIIPEIDLKNTTLEDALKLVELRTRELDNTTLDDGRRGVEIEAQLPQLLPGSGGLGGGGGLAGDSYLVPELKLKNVPAETALKYLAEISKTRYQIDKNGKVTFKPSGYEDTADIIQRQWEVSDGFLDFLGSAKGRTLMAEDPFSNEEGRLIETDKGIAELLRDNGIQLGKQSGVSFPEKEGVLIVRSTPAQVEVFDQLVKAYKEYKAKEEAEKQRRLERQNFETPTAEKSDSTFSLNVSDVSFKLAKAALEEGKRPEVSKVRAEEFVNALDYGDDRPTQAEKVSCEFEQGAHPFLSQRNLMRISMSTASLGRNAGTPLRLTLLLDQSGSMERADRVESLKRAFALLSAQLNANDEVTLIGFARTPRLLAERVKGNEVAKLAEIIANPITAGGTNLEEALSTGIQLAKQQFLKGAQNRVILLTDGAANLGDAKPETLAMQVESMRKAGIAFDACGVGADGLNDEVLSSLAKKGDGRYYFLDRPEDADEGFARQIAGALRPAAKNVKVQVLFNPERVTSFKLYGFEKHQLKKEDFRNDKVDAAEMAAEESGVALYHFEPNPEGRGDVGTVSVRFLDTASNEMVERTWLIPYEPQVAFFNEADPKLRLAGVAGLFAERLKGSAVGERVELKRLRQELPGLKARFGNQPRVHELETMLRQAGE